MPSEDKFSSQSVGQDSPAEGAFVIMPHNTSDMAGVTRGIYVGVGGDIAVIMKLDAAIEMVTVFKNVPTGAVLPIRADRVMATDTSATDLVGLV